MLPKQAPTTNYLQLGIKSMAGLKTFVEEWNGHNTIAHPLQFDELLQGSHFSLFL